MFDTLIKPIAIALGKFLDVIFTGMDNIGIGNIGIAIIIFTIIVKVAMMPLIFSQQKTVKVTQIMQPEIKAIRAKYKGRSDQESMQMQNQEIKAVYAKYGASQTGGCIQLLIQLPILLALYNVFRNLPLYLDRLNVRLTDILSSLYTHNDFLDKMNNNFGGVNWSFHDDAVSGLNAFTAEKWSQLQELFPSSASIIAENSPKILNMNNFLGVHTSIEPAVAMGLSILVPILAGVSQFISARLAQNVQGDDRAAKIQAILMSTMMPVISVVFAFRVPAGLGIYWITTAVVQTVIQLIINRYYKNMSAEEIIAKAEEKRMKKLEKKARRRNVDPETLVKSATLKTKKLGKGNTVEDQFANTTFKERATLSKTAPKVKAKNVKPVQGSGGSGLNSNKTANANKGAPPEAKLDPKYAEKARREAEKQKEAAAKRVEKEAKRKVKSGEKPLSEMAGKVQEFNEGKGSSGKKNKKK